jgi:hypothetical protein
MPLTTFAPVGSAPTTGGVSCADATNGMVLPKMAHNRVRILLGANCELAIINLKNINVPCFGFERGKGRIKH